MQPPMQVAFPQRPRADRRSANPALRSAAAVIVVLLLCATTALGGYWVTKRVTGHGHGTAGAAPDPTPTQPSTSTGPIGAGGALPAGYRTYHSTDGYTVAVPATWKARTLRPGVVELDDPSKAADRFLRFVTNIGTPTTLLASFQAAERAFIPAHTGYHRISLAPTTVHGRPAAEWEFTFTAAGVARHVRYRAFSIGGKTYGVYASSPEPTYRKTLASFAVAARSFAAP